MVRRLDALLTEYYERPQSKPLVIKPGSPGPLDSKRFDKHVKRSITEKRRIRLLDWDIEVKAEEQVVLLENCTLNFAAAKGEVVFYSYYYTTEDTIGQQVELIPKWALEALTGPERKVVLHA